MQPYLFPYLGYWQMISNADVFVLFDDVNFIKKGWINRNNILLNEQTHLFTLPLEKTSQNKLICEINVTQNINEKQNILKTIELAYKKTPFFEDIFPIVTDVFYYNNYNISYYLLHQFEKIFNYLDIKTELVLSSTIKKNNALKGEDKIIDICKILGTDTYINAIGGQELYNKERFQNENINLNFIKMRDIKYKQIGNNFVPNLSIIDVLMFNNKEKIKEMLKEYDLI